MTTKCGRDIFPGRCAEFRTAHNLIRSGSKLKNIWWTQPYSVEKGPMGHLVKKVQRDPCDVCNDTLGTGRFHLD